MGIAGDGRYGRKGVAINLINERKLYYLNELEQHYNITIDDLPQNVNVELFEYLKKYCI